MSDYIRITFRRKNGALSSLSVSVDEHCRLVRLAAGDNHLVRQLLRRAAKRQASMSLGRRSRLSREIVEQQLLEIAKAA
jgi:hypothetical protein